MTTRVHVSAHRREIPKQRTKVKSYYRTITGKRKKRKASALVF